MKTRKKMERKRRLNKKKKRKNKNKKKLILPKLILFTKINI